MLGARVFRVFVSSTFTDMVAERNALNERVFGELRAHCAARGFGFQAVDLRWGIGDEASSGHRTMRTCLSEIARCQAISPRPNFIVLLGSRYGWRPLPEIVDAAELHRLIPHLAPSDAALVEACYAREENAVPPVYALRHRSTTAFGWDDAQQRLRPVLAAAAQAAGLDQGTRAKYHTSATEQEIVEGALNAPGAQDHVFCFVRETTGLPDDTGAFRDLAASGEPDEEAAVRLADLKKRVRARLPGHVFEYIAEWRDGALSMTHLNRMCEDVESALRDVMDAEMERLGQMTHLDQERAAHEAFARERSETFVGRGAYLDRVADYLRGPTAQPLCVFAGGGLGKSALMATAAARARAAHPQAIQVARHIGVTSSSADLRSLLQDLCAEIGDAYGSLDSVPSALPELVQELPRRLALAAPDRPLILFLDALDQLSGGGQANLSWLPSKVPPGVHLVTTTRPGLELAALRERLPDRQVVELGPMSVEEGGELLDAGLAAAGRRLGRAQREAVLRRFVVTGSPLFLRLAMEEARLWPHTLGDVRLGADVPAVIGDLFDRLEKEHWFQLVGHALGFLACTNDRLGLSEDELLDALAADDETWAEFLAGARWSLAARQLPVVVWSRLYLDLAPYLSPRSSEGAALLSFFHRELAETARSRYVDDDATHPQRAAHLHGVLADVLRALARARADHDREWTGSAHALAELPYHLTMAERWEDLLATLTDFTYLEAKAKRVAVSVATDAEGRDATVYNGVLALVEDFDRALERLPAGVDR